ncbi:MAG: HNH endonuclease [Methanosphaera sp.]|nr:HNH endonuclease [Methanosphaera sp.]
MLNLNNFKVVDLPNIKKDVYYISPEGQIYSKFKKGILRSKYDKDGYKELSLRTEDNKAKFFKIHTLVALTYIGFPPKNLLDPTIDHIDENRTNNHYTNLRWVERWYNSSIRTHKGKGEENHEAILSNNEVLKICELLCERQLSLKQIGKLFGVTKSTISNIKRKKSWKHITEKYNFY